MFGEIKGKKINKEPTYIYDSQIDELFELKSYNINIPTEPIYVFGCCTPVDYFQCYQVFDFKGINRNGLDVELKQLQIPYVGDRFLILR